MSHPLLVFSTFFLRISERYEPEGGGDRPHPPTEPRHIASVSHLRTRDLSPLLADVLTCVLTFVATAIHLGQIKQQHFSVAVGCEF